MIRYLLLQHPGHNRVYYNSAGELALSELKLACLRLSQACNNIDIVEISNVRYLSFTTNEDLLDSDLQILSRLSFVFALYKEAKLQESICLVPLVKDTYESIDQKISSLLKYSGKTNELFTKMMINVALLSSNFSYSDRILLLDPVAGKGTTLFESAVYGFDAMGIEIDKKAAQESGAFFKKYLQVERYKHITDERQVFGKNKAEAIYAQEFEYGASKDDFKDDNLRRKLGVVNGSTLDADKYFKKESFHLIVGDLPYGIAHGNSVTNKAGSITRNPSELLDQCLPQWQQVLKKGGVVVVAWNSFVISRHKLTKVFASHGFEVLSSDLYDNFEHMVDQSIKRDIIVAKK